MAIGKITGSVVADNTLTESNLAFGISGQSAATSWAADTLKVNIIESDDSTAIQLNDSLNISGTLSANTIDVNTLTSGDSSGININDTALYVNGDRVATMTGTETLENKTLRAPIFESSDNSPQFIEQRYVNANQLNFVQVYYGAANGSYFTQGEYQKIATIIPDGDSQNYTCKVTMTATSAAAFHIVTFYAALRSNTRPDLDWTITYDEQHNGTRFIEPMLWTKETTTAGFILAFEYIHSSVLYGNVNCNVEIIPRSAAQRNNVTINTTGNSETTSIETGYTERNPTLIQSNVSGVPVFNQTIRFEGATDDDFETSITVTDPTADRTITIPDASGTLALLSDITGVASDTLTFTNKTFDANGTGNSITNIEVGDFASGEILDEDDMSSNSATKLATQQSIKAYVDSATASLSTTLGISDSASNTGSLTVGTNDLEFRSGDSITATVAGTGVTFDLNETISVDTITSGDSTAITFDSPIIAGSSFKFNGDAQAITTVLDEDNMSSNSATALATQQSIKAYVDSQAGGNASFTFVGDDSTGATVENGDSIQFKGGEGVQITVDDDSSKGFAVVNVTSTAAINIDGGNATTDYNLERILLDGGGA